MSLFSLPIALISLISVMPLSDKTIYTYEWKLDTTAMEEVIANLPMEEVVEEAVEKEVKEEVKYDPAACSCVIYVAHKLPLPPIKTPADLEPNTYMREGAAVLLDYNVSHIAYIEKIDNRGILISESNFKKCKYGQRWLRFDDPAIRGFYKPS